MFLFYLENLLPDLLIGKRKKDIQETGERGRKKEGTSSGDPQQEVKAQGRSGLETKIPFVDTSPSEPKD